MRPRALLPLAADGGGRVGAACPPTGSSSRFLQTAASLDVSGGFAAVDPAPALPCPRLRGLHLRAPRMRGAPRRCPAVTRPSCRPRPWALHILTPSAEAGLRHPVAEASLSPDGPGAESRPVLRPSGREAESRGGVWAPRAAEPARLGEAAVWCGRRASPAGPRRTPCWRGAGGLGAGAQALSRAAGLDPGATTVTGPRCPAPRAPTAPSANGGRARLRGPL